MKRYLLLCVVVTMLAMISGQVAVAAPGFEGGGTVYYVTWGDSLSDIAARYGVSVDAILRANGLTNPNLIYVGQPLIIPGGTSGYPHTTGCANYYTVKAGDTLSMIAWNYNTTIQQLLQLNNLYNKDVLYVGQSICVPAQSGYAPQPVGYRPPATVYYHTVARGETLSSIAYRYGVNNWTIVQANNLANPSFIWPGQQLIIPGYQADQYDGYPQYDGSPQYHRQPPPAPVYDDTYKTYKDSSEEGSVVDLRASAKVDTGIPPAPDYQPVPVSAALPRAEHPIEVEVNGGESWVDDVYPKKRDPNDITTLIVQTGEENGKTVRVRSGDAETSDESRFTGEFGAFRFVFRYIPPGDYDVWIDDPDLPSETAQVQIEAGERVEIAFRRGVSFQGQTFASPDGWVLSGWDNPSKPGQNIGGWSNILVKAPASGLLFIAESEGGGYRAKCLTGSKGPGACDFAGLSAGIYFIWIDGTDLKLKTYMDGNAYATFEFARQP
jgi:LysM repeat protein